MNKSENAKLVLMIKMAEKRFSFHLFFCKIKCQTLNYQLHCT